MVTSTPLASSSLAAAFGRSTSAAGFTIAEVVIMKMMRSTRNTSVSGVTLISATMWPRVCALPKNAIRPPRRGDRLEHARAADAKRRVDALDARLEVVVADHRDDPDGEAERGRDERLGDAAGHHREAARAGDRHGVEGADDAHYRAEEPDERRRRADRAEHPEIRPAALDRLELSLVGHPLELRERRLGRGAEQVAVHPPRRTGPVAPDELARSLEVAAGQHGDHLCGERH